jgi:hypothetical protein
VIVPCHGEESALGRRTLEIAELERFARPIHTDSLAVPQAKYALEIGFSEPLQLLRAANGADSQLFVETRHEADRVCVEQLLGCP